jgi:hypothetical protein
MILISVVLYLSSFTQVPSVPQSVRVEALGKQVVKTLHDRDIKGFAKLIHPVKGVRFSPQEFVRKEHQVFTSEQIKALTRDGTQYTWGEDLGSGKVIKMNFPSYYKQFLYDRDFAKATMTSRTVLLGRGSMANNIDQFYPTSTRVEYHFPAKKGKNDWGSLWLVFEEYQEQLYLVGIVHGKCTC